MYNSSQFLLIYYQRNSSKGTKDAKGAYLHTFNAKSPYSKCEKGAYILILPSQSNLSFNKLIQNVTF